MKIDGSCQCGAITFEAEIDPKQVSICHCTDCQAFSGSAFRVSVPAAAKDFTLKSGEPKAYVKTAESGNKRVQMFCPTCGTHVYTTDPEKSATSTYRLRVGTISQREALKPSVQIWCRSELPWVRNLASVPRRGGQ
jgi:hypothetical protein